MERIRFQSTLMEKMDIKLTMTTVFQMLLLERKNKTPAFYNQLNKKDTSIDTPTRIRKS